MEKEFIKYTEALALKELGFDEKCLGYYIKNSSLWCNWLDVKFNDDPSNDKEDFVADAPLYQQAFKWFREKYGLKGEVDTADMIWSKWSFKTELKGSTYILYSGLTEKIYFNTYEEAELACLKKLIEIVKEKL